MKNEIQKIINNLKTSQINRNRLLGFVIIDLILAGLSVLYPAFIGKIISLSTSENFDNSFDKIYKYTFLFILLLIIWLIFGYINIILKNKQNQIILSRLRKRMLQSLFLMPRSVKEQNGSGYYQDRILNETEAVSGFFYDIWGALTATITTIIVVLLIMLYISPLLTILSMIILPISSYVAKKASKKIQQYSDENKEAEATLSEYYQESIKTEKSIVVFYRIDIMLKKIDILVDNLIEKVLRLSKLRYITYSISGTLGYYINGLIVLVVGGNLVLQGKLDSGLWIAFYFYPQYLWGAIEELFGHYYAFLEYNIIWNRLNNIIQYENSCFYQKIKSIELNSFTAKNVSFGYNEKKIINNFTYNFYKNKVYVIMGESGKGKTTLLKILSRQINKNHGHILINNAEKINFFPSKDSEIQIGILYQNSDIFKESLVDNIIGCFEFNQNKFDKIIKSVQLDNFLSELPKMENTILSESGNSLSGGQIQRIGIARLLYQNSKIWLMDEPTASLDEENEKQILEIIKNNKKEKIIICVSHRIIFKTIADDVINL